MTNEEKKKRRKLNRSKQKKKKGQFPWSMNKKTFANLKFNYYLYINVKYHLCNKEKLLRRRRNCKI